MSVSDIPSSQTSTEEVPPYKFFSTENNNDFENLSRYVNYPLKNISLKFIRWCLGMHVLIYSSLYLKINLNDFLCSFV